MLFHPSRRNRKDDVDVLAGASASRASSPGDSEAGSEIVEQGSVQMVGHSERGVGAAIWNLGIGFVCGRYLRISGRTEFPKTNGPRPTAESAADRRLVGSNPTCGAKHLHNRFCALLVDWVAARICANWPIVSKTVFSAAVNTTHTAKHQARPARFQSQFLNVSAQRRAFG